MRALQQLVYPFFPNLFLQIYKAHKAHNGGYLTQSRTNASINGSSSIRVSPH